MMRSSSIPHVSSLVWHTRNTNGHLNTFSILTERRLSLSVRRDGRMVNHTNPRRPTLHRYCVIVIAISETAQLLIARFHGCEEVYRKTDASLPRLSRRRGENYRKRIRKFGKRCFLDRAQTRWRINNVHITVNGSYVLRNPGFSDGDNAVRWDKTAINDTTFRADDKFEARKFRGKFNCFWKV